MAEKEVTVVNRQNLKVEFDKIRDYLKSGAYVAMDTEYPGTVKPALKRYFERSLEENYNFMKENVDDTKLIQLGLTVCNNMMKPAEAAVWEFNFNEFDLFKDNKNLASISLLKNAGVDFKENKKEGISCEEFAEEFKKSFKTELNLKWVFFHCTDDLGYLIKILLPKKSGKQLLPKSLAGFLGQVRYHLGESVYDVKEMVTEFNWHFGLNKVAQNLNVPRMMGQSHQAGSDSFLTLLCFRQVVLLLGVEREDVLKYSWSYKLHGLTSKPQPPPLPAAVYFEEPNYVSYYLPAHQEHPQFSFVVNNYILLA